MRFRSKNRRLAGCMTWQLYEQNDTHCILKGIFCEAKDF